MNLKYLRWIFQTITFLVSWCLPMSLKRWPKIHQVNTRGKATNSIEGLWPTGLRICESSEKMPARMTGRWPFFFHSCIKLLEKVLEKIIQIKRPEINAVKFTSKKIILMGIFWPLQSYRLIIWGASAGYFLKRYMLNRMPNSCCLRQLHCFIFFYYKKN